MSNSKQVGSESGITHLAIIPDGNRRWAKKQRIFGTLKMYDQGGETAAEVIRAAFEEGIKCVSFWGGSEANLTSRDKNEVKVLDEIYQRFSKRLVKDVDVHDKQVKVEVIGRWRQLLSEKTVEAIEDMIKATKDYSERTLVLLVGYDGVAERSAAVNKLLKDKPQENVDGNNLLKKYAWTGDLPNVDLIIRTGAWHDPHNSVGFLSLLTDNVQYEFPEVLWPDFTAESLKNIINQFSTRERRYGQ